MKALGSYFKTKREEQGYTLEEIARKTNIPSRYLEAIENQNFDAFPAGVYAKGFIRTYARTLDLDPDALVMEYSLNFEDEGEPEEEETPARSRWAYVVMLIGLLLVGVTVVLFRFAWIHPEYAHPTLSEPSPPSPDVSEPAASASIDLEESHDRLKLQVLSTQKTYIFAVFDGLRKQEMVLLPGERRTWDAEETIRIRTGNPGGLTFYHRGKQLPSLGRSGEVVDKVIQLKDDQLNIHSVLADRNTSSNQP